ncbi:MAG: hypothetical protein B6D73_15145 [gamma proteobacterium symbiont of Stewartia floridana]|nr:MAG: hypothetical protein B6D73_15145 [gamma proteobacterium symbiont of Stewartia floridana]
MKKQLAFQFFILSLSFCAYAEDDHSLSDFEHGLPKNIDTMVWPRHSSTLARDPFKVPVGVSKSGQVPNASRTQTFGPTSPYSFNPYTGYSGLPMYYANVPSARDFQIVSQEREILSELISTQTEAINSLYEVVKRLEKRLDEIEGKLP